MKKRIVLSYFAGLLSMFGLSYVLYESGQRKLRNMPPPDPSTRVPDVSLPLTRDDIFDDQLTQELRHLGLYRS